MSGDVHLSYYHLKLCASSVLQNSIQPLKLTFTENIMYKEMLQYELSKQKKQVLDLSVQSHL